MDDLQELLIREEARFVLWALRCAAAEMAGNDDAAAELRRGFELVDVPETAPAFRDFARALCRDAGDRIAWHDPQCACVSAQEMAVLYAVATTAERLAQADPQPDSGWQVVVPWPVTRRIDRLARGWLDALREAGICFPCPAEMVASLSPLANFIEPPAGARLQ